MLNQMRRLAGSYVAKLLLLLLILSFGVWGIGDMVRGNGANEAVATVGSEKITVMEYRRSLQREMDNIRRSLGDQYSPELLKNINVPQVVLRRLVNHQLLALASSDEGIVPPDSAIARRIRANPSFADASGNFSKERFQNTLRAMGYNEKSYIDEMRGELAGNLLMDSVASAAYVPETAARTIYAAIEEQRSATLYTISEAALGPIALPGDEALETFYREHADAYSMPEYRSFSYIRFSPDAIRNRISLTDEELQAAYSERQGEFRRDEQRMVEQMLFADEDKASAAMAQLKAGKDFAAVAKQSALLNKDSVSLGLVERGRMLESAEDAVFALPKNGFTDIIKSPFGYHIFHVSQIKSNSTAEFEEVRAALEKELLQSRFEEELSHFSNRLQDMLAGGQTFADAAKELGMEVKTTEAVTAEGLDAQGRKSKTLPPFEKFLETGFRTDEGSESALLADKSGTYFLLRTEKISPKQPRPFEEVRPRVEADWRAQEKREKLAELAEDAQKMVSDAGTRAQALARYKLKATQLRDLKQQANDKTHKLPSALLAEIFTIPTGSVTQPYAMNDGTYGMALIGAVTQPDMKSADQEMLAQIRQTLEQQQADELIDQYMRYLAERYSVSLNEELLGTLTSNADQ